MHFERRLVVVRDKPVNSEFGIIHTHLSLLCLSSVSQQLSLSCLSVGSFFKASLWAILQVKLNTDHVYCFDKKVCTPALPAYQKLSRRIVYV